MENQDNKLVLCKLMASTYGNEEITLNEQVFLLASIHMKGPFQKKKKNPYERHARTSIWALTPYTYAVLTKSRNPQYPPWFTLSSFLLALVIYEDIGHQLGTGSVSSPLFSPVNVMSRFMILLIHLWSRKPRWKEEVLGAATCKYVCYCWCTTFSGTDVFLGLFSL